MGFLRGYSRWTRITGSVYWNKHHVVTDVASQIRHLSWFERVGVRKSHALMPISKGHPQGRIIPNALGNPDRPPRKFEPLLRKRLFSFLKSEIGFNRPNKSDK
jgi:hypothetical protein